MKLAVAPQKSLVIDGESLAIEDAVRVARYGVSVELSMQAKRKMSKSYHKVQEFVDRKEVVYGITTGFGEFSNVTISQEQTRKLQQNLLESHAVAVGNPLPEEVVRGMMLLRANALAKGYSGVRPEIVEKLIELLNKGVHPVVPEQGSLGASGDLSPLAHMALVVISSGEAFYQGERLSGTEALKRAGIAAMQLEAKEGLALINGTQMMNSIGVLASYDAYNLARIADIVGAITFEALEGIVSAYDPRISEVRRYQGQRDSAQTMRMLVKDSEILAKAKHGRVQDAYTLRCIPQVHGATRDAVDYVAQVMAVEMNSSTDNPLIFPEDNTVISGGNFHGQPLALSLDFLGIAVAELGSISERRIERLVNPHLSGLPPFLTEKGGINSGFMIAHYTTASLASENKVLASPACVDSIPTSAGQEDHVSMGGTSARTARQIVNNVQQILAVELLCACQAVDLRGGKLGVGTIPAYEVLRSKVLKLEDDRLLYPDLAKAAELIRDGSILDAVQSVVGRLP